MCGWELGSCSLGARLRVGREPRDSQLFAFVLCAIRGIAESHRRPATADPAGCRVRENGVARAPSLRRIRVASSALTNPLGDGVFPSPWRRGRLARSPCLPSVNAHSGIGGRPMSRLRLALALVILALSSTPQRAAASGECPNIWYHPSTGYCSMTGRTQGSCVCEYECSGTEEPLNWFSFC